MTDEYETTMFMDPRRALVKDLLDVAIQGVPEHGDQILADLAMATMVISECLEMDLSEVYNLMFVSQYNAKLAAKSILGDLDNG